ncbi:immunoglobulin domain-containing protein [Puniceicoccaceae bacterium K14]|nr:immunoglobulin domain-containing protein [Puniceicoccaceae bacterium K14]
MNTNILKKFLLCFLVLVPTFSALGQRYEVGDIVEDFTLIDRETGQEVSLYDLEGQVIFLEWFAWWCPFCSAAAHQIEPGIVEYYANLEGNPNGVPFKHVGLNLQGLQEADTQDFIDSFNFETVWNDFDRSASSLFQSGGQPIFAIINGVANSPSHEQWELIFTRLGFNDLEGPIAAFRAAIDAVEGPVVQSNDGPPSIVEHPVSQTLSEGSTFLLSVGVENASGASYQWLKDGVVFTEGASNQIEISSVAGADEGDYTVVVSTEIGTAESRFARLTVATLEPGDIINMSVRSLTGVGGEPLIMGFVADGGDLEILARGVGPSLMDQGVDNPLANPIAILVESLPDNFVQNDDWHIEYPNANNEVFADVGAFSLGAGSLDSAIVNTIDGLRTVVISDASGGEGIALAELYDLGVGSGKLVNVSARNLVGEGENVLIVGFVISGNEPKRLLIRGVGPGLSTQGVSNVLTDPQLSLVTSINEVNTIVAFNDNWEDEAMADQAAVVVPGAFELDAGSKDSMIMMTVPAGIYTAILSGVNSGTGVGLLEVYLAE